MLRVQIEPQYPVALAMGNQEQAAICDQPIAFISAQGTELCVVCHVDTGVAVREPIDTRPNYVSGVGQCCESCSTLR